MNTLASPTATMESQTRSMIADSVARLFRDSIDHALLLDLDQGRPATGLWHLAVDNGLPAALAPAESGGIGASFSDAWPLFHAVGYWQVPLPLLETMVARQIAGVCGVDAPDGPATVMTAEHLAQATVRPQGDGFVLSGAAHGVPWARQADWALAEFRQPDGSVRIATVALAGARIAPGQNMAAEPRDDIAFDGSVSGAAAALQAPVLLPLMALARAIAMVGAMESALERTVVFAGDRVQFGRALGKFQAIQHSLATMAAETANARLAAQVACDSVPETLAGSEAVRRFTFDAAVAKLHASAAASGVARTAHQVHGAIGFTQEHMLHFATRRLWSWRGEDGSDAFWARLIGRAAIAGGGAGFWPGLTARAFTLEA